MTKRAVALLVSLLLPFVSVYAVLFFAVSLMDMKYEPYYFSMALLMIIPLSLSMHSKLRDKDKYVI